MTHIISEYSIGNAHRRAIKEVLRDGKPLLTEDGEETVELIPLIVHIDSPLASPMIYEKIGMGQKFMDEYAAQLMNPDYKGFAYTYGNRFREYCYQSSHPPIDQLSVVLQMLIENPTTRRAIMHTWQVGRDLHGKEVPCIQTIQFFIRDGILDCIVYIRSNDILMAYGANMYGIARMMEWVVAQINNSDKMLISMGSITSISASAHIYVKRDASVLEML
jgi:thymidylate synthase